LIAWLPRQDFFQAYANKALPLLLWFILALTQAWIFLVALMRQKIIEAARSFTPTNHVKPGHPINIIDKKLLVTLIGVSIVYILIQTRSFLTVREAFLIGDSWSYLYGAGLSLTDPAFFSERRPWAILLIFKLLGSSEAAIEIFQLSLSTFAWLFLAWTFIRTIKKWWGILIGFTLILGYSLTPSVQIWNHAVLSESTSISFMILLLATFISLSLRWSWRSFLLASLVAILWMSIREANTYICLLGALVLIILGLSRKNLRVYWLLSLIILGTFAINYQLSAAYGLPRWALPLAEVITHRILPEREYLEFFSENGMPVSTELMAFSGKNANSQNYAIINSNKFRKFSKWLFSEGKNVYVKFLLAHPLYTIESPLENIRVLLAADYLDGIPIPRYTPALPRQVNDLFYPINWFWSYLWISLFASGAIIANNFRTRNEPLWIIFIFLLLSVPHLYLIWHGDALDVARHAVIANVQYHIGFILIVILFLDSFKKA
jgi:hypothetical protein